MSTIHKYFLLLESNTTGTGRMFAAAARQVGLCPLLLSREPSRYPYVNDDKIDVYQVDTSNLSVLAGLVDELATANQVAGIYSSSEYWIESAALLAQRLGLPGPDPEAISLCRNKWKQRNRLKEAGLPVPKFQCVASVEECRNDRELPPCVVVKPTEGSGSVGVRLCRTQAEILNHVENLLACKFNERGLPIPQQVLIEQYLPGPEYSVEMFGLETIGVTKKHLSSEPHFVEIGHDFPASLDPDIFRAIKDSATRAVQAVGLTWGPIHVELRYTANGPFVVEINPRLAGGFIPELVRQSTGIDLIQNTILAAIGRQTALQAVDSRCTSIRFLMPKNNGVLHAVQGMDRLRRMETVKQVLLYRKVGDFITCRGDFRDRLGHVMTCHESPDIAVDSATRAAEILVAETL